MLLQDDLLELAAKDRRVIQTFVESDWGGLKTALSEYQTLRREIRTRLLDQTVVSISDPDAVALLKKVTTGEGLPTDKFLQHLHSLSGSDEAYEEFGDADFEALGSDLLYSWFSHYEYIRGLAELRPLAVSDAVGESVVRIVGQVRSCYAFQQYDAAYSLCRAALEASIRDICVRRRLFPNLGENVILFEKFNWSQLRDKVSYGELRQQLNTLYADLSAVLHGRRTVAKDEARRAFESTLRIIEELYAVQTA
jgi:hypothetical protein